jgi:pimeloyl-ACP methyl ester carboxylesterase
MTRAFLATLAGAARFRRRRHASHWQPPSGQTHMGTLAARVLGDPGSGGLTVVLLHGLVASGRYWGAEFDALSESGALVVPDLLGFGASPRPDCLYGPTEHVDAVLGCLRELGAEKSPLFIGAHSMGVVIAAQLAARHPDRVIGIVGFGPPLYRTRSEARSRIASLGLMARLFALDTRTAHQACQWVCEHRRLAATLAVLTRGGLPAPIARDGVEHSWASYSRSVDRLILSTDAVPLIERLHLPIRFVVGVDDPIPDQDLLAELALFGHISLTVWSGADHGVVIEQPERCAAELLDAIATALG